MTVSFSAGKKNKIYVSVDGEYAFTVDAEYWFSSPYCNVSEITVDSEIDEFYQAVGARSAFISALNFLSYGDNSRRTLQRKLVTKGHRKEYAAAALDRLEELGYVDDRRYAENLAERLLRSKHMSRAGIKRELTQRGVDRALADEVADALETDPREEITALLETKYKNCLSDEKGLRKTVAGLQRLGYGYSDIKEAIEAVLEEIQ